MKLIVISSSDKKNEDEPAIVTQLFENGLKYFHLRKPGCTYKYLEEYIKRIPEKYRGQVVIHSHFSLVLKYKLKGIHFNRRKRKKSWKRRFMTWYYRFRKPNISITTSFHNLATLYDDDYQYDYVFLSPIFDSITKSGFQSAFTKNNLAQAMARSKHKIEAFGGVDIGKLDSCLDMKFDGVVLSGCLWQSQTPVENFKAIKHKLLEMDALD